MIPTIVRAAGMVAMLTSTVASADSISGGAETRFGIGLGHYAIAAAQDLDGGSYLAVSLCVFFSDSVVAELDYCTDITPNLFKDHVVSTDAMIRIVDAREFAIAIGPMFLKNVTKGFEGNYFGIKVIPISSWKAQHGAEQKFTFNLLPLAVLYGINSGSFVWTFSFFEVQVFF
jgi:hypothetical protein